MAIFAVDQDRQFFEGLNKEAYRLYCPTIDVYKIQKNTGKFDNIYSEDIDYDLPDTPTYSIPGYVDVSDAGSGNLTKAGEDVARETKVFFSQKEIEETLARLGLNPERDRPDDGDILYFQDHQWEIIRTEYGGYHTNVRNWPYDAVALVHYGHREAINRPRFRRM